MASSLVGKWPLPKVGPISLVGKWPLPKVGLISLVGKCPLPKVGPISLVGKWPLPKVGPISLVGKWPHSAAAATNVERFGCPHTRPGSPDHSSLRDVWRAYAIRPYTSTRQTWQASLMPPAKLRSPASARLGLRKPRTYLCPRQKRSGWRSLNGYFSLLLTTPNYIILPL